MCMLKHKRMDRLLICLEALVGEALVQSRGDRTQKGKMVDMSLHVFVLIEQTIHSHLVIQLSNSTGCLFLIADWQRKNRQGNLYKNHAKTVLSNYYRNKSLFFTSQALSLGHRKTEHYGQTACTASACMCYGCIVTGAGFTLHRHSPVLCQSSGAGPVTMPRILSSVSAVTECLGRVPSLLTIKPEVNYSSHNKVVLKESK